MRAKGIFIALFVSANIAGAAMAVAQGNGNGNGKGGGGGGGNDGGGEDPPAAFVPEVAYFAEGRKSKDLRLANRAGDQACLVLRSEDGSPTLRGFNFDTQNQRLAYSLGETGIYLASWTDADGPCSVDVASEIEVRALSPGNHAEFMDFSPDGNLLVWSENGTNDDARLWIYNTGTGAVESLPLSGWSIFGMRFSPDFASTQEVVFVGGNRDGSTGTAWSLFAYDISSSVLAGSNPRQIFDATKAGANLDAFVTVTNPQGTGASRIAVTDNESGQVLQFDLGGTPQGNGFSGYEPQYSCVNDEIIHRFRANQRSYDLYITSADGNSSVRWSSDDGRWLDWLCPNTSP